ncbi:MAG: hypothetical protein AAB453_02575 [Patescibacteria group bacterium]
MFTIIFGTDRECARASWRKLVASAKKNENEIFTFHNENWSEEKFEELINSQNIFGNKLTAVCDHLFSNEEAREFVGARAGDLVESKNEFIFLETAVSKELLKILEKVGAKIENFEAKSKSDNKYEGFNIFSITDALASRNRKNAWLLLTEGLESGLEAEEIFWKFVWQIKNLLLVKSMGDKPIAGLKPYPLSKAKGYAKNFKIEELRALSGRLVNIYSNARQGKQDFATALERLILEY